MPDEPTPPRKVYGFKPREFERANAAPPSASAAAPVQPDPGIVAADPGKIDVNDLIRAGARTTKPLGSNQVVNRANEVHDMLKENLQRDIAAGGYDLGVLDDSKRRRRLRNYCIGMVLVNGPLGFFAYYVGHTNALPFVCALAGMGMISAKMTWETFFFRTHY